MTLKQEHCEACRADAPAASQAEIGAWRDEIPDWKLIEEEGVQKLERQFSFPDFVAAMAFTGKVAALAESRRPPPGPADRMGQGHGHLVGRTNCAACTATTLSAPHVPTPLAND